MSSTRLNNLPCTYKAQEQRKEHIADHIAYKYNGQAYNTKLPGFTVLAGQVGPDQFAYNYANVDSFLKGTYFNNLENPRREFTPRIKCLKSAKFIETEPTYVPEPLVIEKCQRLDIFRR